MEIANIKEAGKGIFGSGNSICKDRVIQQDDVCREGHGGSVHWSEGYLRQ